jgi:DNA polymerase-3 subunit epsilon
MLPISFVAIRFDYADFDLDSACAIGLVKVENGEPTAVLYEKFIPFSGILQFVEDASQTGGLRPVDLKNAGSFSSIWPAVQAFVGGLPLVANSATTYMRTLEILWEDSELSSPAIPYLCTQVLGRRVTDLGSFSLDFYAHAFGYELPELATALDKSKATAAIMLGLVTQAKAGSLNELAEISDVRWGSISSEERISCKSNRRYEESASKAGLQAIRDSFEADGFDETHPLFEKYVLVTGTLRKGTGAEIDNLLAKVGAYPELNFTKKTNFLVVGYDRIDGLLPGGKPTGKIMKSIEARAKGQLVEVIDEQAFLNLLED